jgi:hypothetical protein
MEFDFYFSVLYLPPSIKRDANLDSSPSIASSNLESLVEITLVFSQEQYGMFADCLDKHIMDPLRRDTPSNESLNTA